MCVQNFIKLTAAVHELSTVHNSRLQSRISLERIKQSTSRKPKFPQNSGFSAQNFVFLEKKSKIRKCSDHSRGWLLNFTPPSTMPQTSCQGNVHIDFNFSTLFCFQVRSQYGTLTDTDQNAALCSMRTAAC